MKKLLILVLLVLVVFSLSGCFTRTIYVAYSIPPPLTDSVVEPYLEGDDNDALHRYAQECRSALRTCNSQLTNIRETQK